VLDHSNLSRSTAATNHGLASTLQSCLRLHRPPVAVAFVESRPVGVPDARGPAPSACTFWLRAEQGVLYAAAEDHFQCPIGAMTMGFELPGPAKTAAMDLIDTMVSLNYFARDEVAHLPSVQKPHAGIVYGPLADLPVQPDLVLLVVTPYQAMLLAEAGGNTALSETPGLAAMGRPACSALSRAFNQAQTTLSLGCIGARTYAEIPEDRAVVVIPAAQIQETVARLVTLVRANDTLAQYHGQKKSQFSGPAS
jgi:uncharacterized protein (DUF169 family)